MKSMKRARIASNAVVYIVLSVLAIVWLIPILWVVLSSFRTESGIITPYFFPKSYGFINYVKLWTDTSVYLFPRWFLNTFIVAVFSCVLTTLLTLATAYVISKIRFGARKGLMNAALVLGMFPGFMSMIAIYYILRAVDLTQSLVALVFVYSAGAGLNFYIAKGFFDTIPNQLNEAAKIDGAMGSQIFFRIILPLSKPIIVYTALMAFTAPWMDFILARVIMGDASDKFTVAVGLYNMMFRKDADPSVFTLFATGCVCVSLPIVALFLWLQRYYVEGITGGAVKG
ncbi:MAG: sugar ABC transporter permease [Clostridia bacterium]|nr:sugar ABC transporter permease [Clostridia bacterium]